MRLRRADGYRTFTRFLIPEGKDRTDFFRQYPFAWFGILCESRARSSTRSRSGASC